jgi:hypothetical protein
MILNPDIRGDSHASASFETVKGALRNGMYVRDLSIPQLCGSTSIRLILPNPKNFSSCSERLPSLATFGKCVGSLFNIVWFPKLSVLRSDFGHSAEGSAVYLSLKLQRRVEVKV